MLTVVPDPASDDEHPATGESSLIDQTAFDAAYGAKFPKAVAKVTDDVEELLAFYDHQAEHWIHLRTTNPIESTFATVRHRTKVTTGPGSRAAGLAMAFKLIESAQARWRAVNAPPGRARARRCPFRARCPGRTRRRHRSMTLDRQRPRY